jgi:hypothetical protein
MTDNYVFTYPVAAAISTASATVSFSTTIVLPSPPQIDPGWHLHAGAPLELILGAAVVGTIVKFYVDRARAAYASRPRPPA